MNDRIILNKNEMKLFLEKKYNISIKVTELLENENKNERFNLFLIEYPHVNRLIYFKNDLIGLVIESKKFDENDIRFVVNIMILEFLVLKNCLLNTIDFISKYENLIYLVIFHNEISDLTPITNLKNLTNLNLGVNNISDLTPITNLKNLTNLSLDGNKIINLTPITNLINLTNLTLGINQIVDLAPIKTLKNLTNLTLNSNNITDLTPLTSLTNLTNLTLDSNNIKDLSPLTELTNLRNIWLSSNKIKDLTPLNKLKYLITLWIPSNDIKDLAPISTLTNLISLSLNSNQITDLSPLTSLTNLTNLLLNSNQITDLSIFKELFITLSNVSGWSYVLKDNPINTYDKAILSQSGKEIYNYLNNKENKLKLNEVKIIILGNSGVGKSTFVNFYEHSVFKLLKSTHGMEIKRIRLKSDFIDGRMIDHSESIYLNFCDFGGQDYYHNTYRLFLGDVITIVAFQEEDLMIGDGGENLILDNHNEKSENEIKELYNHKSFHPSFWLEVVQDSIKNTELDNIFLLETKRGYHYDNSELQVEFINNVKPDYLRKENFQISIACLGGSDESSITEQSKNLRRIAKAIYEKATNKNTATLPESWIKTVDYIRNSRDERLVNNHIKYLTGNVLFDKFKENYISANPDNITFEVTDCIEKYISMVKLLHEVSLIFVFEVKKAKIWTDEVKIYIDPNNFITSIYDVLNKEYIQNSDCFIDQDYIKSICTRSKCGFKEGVEGDKNYKEYILAFIEKMVSIHTIYLTNPSAINSEKRYFVPQFLSSDTTWEYQKIKDLIAKEYKKYIIRIKKPLYSELWNNFLGVLHTYSEEINIIKVSYTGIEFDYYLKYNFVIIQSKQSEKDEDEKYRHGLVIYTNCEDDKKIIEVLKMLNSSVESLKLGNDILYIIEPHNLNYIRLIDYLKPFDIPRINYYDSSVTNNYIDNKGNLQLGNNNKMNK